MSSEHDIVCGACGTQITPEAPEYYVELECFRLISEREDRVPRRGSKEYHEAAEKFSPEVKVEYFKNRKMYSGGHLWCPECGFRLNETGEGCPI